MSVNLSLMETDDSGQRKYFLDNIIVFVFLLGAVWIVLQPHFRYEEVLCANFHQANEIMRDCILEGLKPRIDCINETQPFGGVNWSQQSSTLGGVLNESSIIREG